jgi:hypothetical protein
MDKHWCGINSDDVMVTGYFSPRECQAKCLELTNGECLAIQWLGYEYKRCYHCKDLTKIDKWNNPSIPFKVYKRGNV